MFILSTFERGISNAPCLTRVARADHKENLPAKINFAHRKPNIYFMTTNIHGVIQENISKPSIRSCINFENV